MHQHRRLALSTRVWLGLTLMGGAVSAVPGTGADLSPAAVADFTRKVQPLVLNKCAAGACHGGPAGTARAGQPRHAGSDAHRPAVQSGLRVGFILVSRRVGRFAGRGVA